MSLPPNTMGQEQVLGESSHPNWEQLLWKPLLFLLADYLQSSLIEDGLPQLSRAGRVERTVGYEHKHD